jgi:glucose-6-phosphate 1-dehydrogenase
MFALLSENGAMERLQDFDLVLFGGTGDPAMRKLLPVTCRGDLAGEWSGEG